MLFRQLFDSVSSTYTYLLADEATKEALLIDPVFEQFQRDAALIEELGLKLVATLDTHVHADHVTGAWLLRERFGSRIGVSKHGGTTGADLLVDEGDTVSFGKRSLSVLSTPGHTDGCVTYVLDDESMAFPGDALLIRGAGRTDFQQGDPHKLFRSVREKLFELPDDTLLYPAHDYSGRMQTSVAEEKQHNPRLCVERSEEDFVGYMKNLGLPHPKQIDVAVPANKQCGKPSELKAPPPKPDWAPVKVTYSGVPELDPHWVAEHKGELRIVDVRTPEEYRGELGHIPGAELVPLDTLKEASERWDKEKPTVAICRSGGRSAQATVILRKEGFMRVANVPHGMIGWRSEGLPVET